jgi:hypothetical protein
MAKNYRKIFNGLQLVGQDTIAPDTAGEIRYNSSTGKFQLYDSALRYVVTDTGSQTLTNKVLSGNTAVTLVSGSGTLTLNTSGTVTLPNATDTLVGKATTDTLTNKTLTSPVINSPTGIVKADVGLSNVDNTSDATKNAATATLTNKTLTSPVINTPTGIVKGDVGLGNVDNTSDSTKNAASVTLTNKTIGDSLSLTHISTPSSPSAGFSKLYSKTGNTLNWVGSDGVEHEATEAASSDPANYLINGAFDFFRRTTSRTSAATDTYTADCFKYTKDTTGAVHTVARSTTVPTLAESGFQSTYSLLVDCTTADASVAAGDRVIISNPIEGFTYAQLKGKQVTLSFWVRATKTGISCVSFRNSGSDRSYVAEYTINSADTWEKKTITLTLNPSGGTDDFTNGLGLSVAWALMAGSTYQTTANAWQTGNFVATSSQVNHCDSTSNDFRIAQVMLNIGPSAQTFRRAGVTIQGERDLCLRYYFKTYNDDVDPATSTVDGGFFFYAPKADFLWWFAYPVGMRISPAVTFYTSTGTSGSWLDATAGANRVMASSSTSTNQRLNFSNSTSTSIGNEIRGHITAEAGL